jgi:hypothetical protein
MYSLQGKWKPDQYAQSYFDSEQAFYLSVSYLQCCREVTMIISQEIYLFIYLFIHLFIYLFIYFCLSSSFSNHPSILAIFFLISSQWLVLHTQEKHRQEGRKKMLEKEERWSISAKDLNYIHFAIFINLFPQLSKLFDY